ncbi:MAG: hypothetical protein HN390_08335 [Anaerolineae bacterium]|jgi:hypothetical protein|nr:hypothetical protein [Anaerolineae bacterium]MBT7070098.1 hypothetical protein [Anaerolineae bacterium]MBT7992004.1 hypothetical protein [Anaerolineae bacterium]
MVPKSLRTWFVIHFIADFLFAIPLLFAPVWMLSLFGWPSVDPFTARLVGAALVGIGGASLLERNASAGTFRAMLNLKLLWSSTAVIGMTITMLTGNYPLIGWGIVAIFVGFFFIWLNYRLQLRESK